MRKYLILTVLLIVAQLNGLQAQSTFMAPDTVCIRQPITMKPLDTTASSYYWSFCSGYMMNRPAGANLGKTFGVNNANDIEIAKDNDGNYYGFLINLNPPSGVPQLIRLEYGNALSNTPTYVNLGDLSGTLPTEANSLFIMKDDAGKWVMFVVGGYTAANSQLFRMDFGTTLSKLPNCVNMGNIGGLLNVPKGIFVAKEGPYWYGFAANQADNKLIRFDFGTNISNTPNAVDLGNPSGAFSGATDMAATKDNNGNWHLFVTNGTTNKLVAVAMGSSLAASPVGTVLSPDPDSLYYPTSIILAKECGVDYAFITNASRNNLVRVAFSDLTSLTFNDISWDFMPGLSSPLALSHFIRDHDNIYAFALNSDNSIGSITFANCTNSSLRSSTSKYPATFAYDQPGDYSVFLSENEGLPNASMECHLIHAEQIPGITIVDDTLVCQGDTANLYIIAFGTDTLKWTPDYNITATSTTVDALFTKVWPDYSRAYHAIAIYPDGCIVDSPIVVNVSKVRADAGVDRHIYDGATTVLGGPMSSEGDSFIYSWHPTNFLNNPLSANPVANPFYDVTYYLTITNNRGCVSSDTVTVYVDCNDLNLPNAFTPESHVGGNDYFGLLNKNIVKLNYFKVFDRWGKLMFSTTDPSQQWDGKFNGVAAPYGVYVWEADGFCSKGQRFTRSGNVTLIR